MKTSSKKKIEKKSRKKILPGEPVRGSKTGRPIVVLLDLLGRKQCLRILWELRLGGLNFRSLRQACDQISPTVLNKRLAELRDACVVEHVDGEGYKLTRQGRKLLLSLEPLNNWAKNWPANLYKKKEI